MRTIYAAALAASLLLPAGTQAEEIIVESGAIAHQAWVRQVSQELDSRLRYPQSLAIFGSQTAGAVSVRFSADRDGKPANLEVVRQSGTRALDREALRAVSNLQSFRLMPTAFQGNKAFRADIVFADSKSEQAYLMRRMQRDNARRLAARSPGQPEEIALTVTRDLRI